MIKEERAKPLFYVFIKKFIITFFPADLTKVFSLFLHECINIAKNVKILRQQQLISYERRQKYHKGLFFIDFFIL